MIRRESGTDLQLITQDDHARLAADFARHLGNSDFAPPSPYNETRQAIAHHDAGWPLHDDEPTLNNAGLPLHVFEVPVPIAVRVWNASVDRAAALGPYQTLLVSLHVLNLSAYAQTHAAPERWTRQDAFEINKFQHRQVETQERLRAELGMSNDAARHLGLAMPGTSPADDQLLFNFRLLTAMDRVSLALCCGKPLFSTIDDVHPRPGKPPAKIIVTMPTPSLMTLDPWPFDTQEIRLSIAARRVSRGPYSSAEEFRQAYYNATVETMELSARKT
jgi:hypothetical protein